MPIKNPLLIFLTLLGLSAVLWAFSGGPMDNMAGNPPDFHSCTFCHVTYPLNSGDGYMYGEGLPSEYTPGETYTLTVTLCDPGQSRWGFEVTALYGNNQQAGTFIITDDTNTMLSDNPGTSPDFVKHTSAGSFAGTLNGPVTWSFDWVAPSPAVGTIVFYASGLAADNNNSHTMDYVYRGKVFTAPPSNCNTGDPDDNTTTNVLDVLAVANHVLGLVLLEGDAFCRADCNADGTVNILDALGIANVILGIGDCGSGGIYKYTQPPETGDGWETASLADVGIDEEDIDAAVEGILTGVYQRVHGLVIIKDGYLVFEEYFEGEVYNSPTRIGPIVQFDRDRIHNLASTTKSITSALVGIAIDHGFISSEQESIYQIFDEYEDLSDELKEKMTMEHLLTMTAGWEWDENTSMTSDNDLYLFNTATDPIRFLLSRPMEAEPGSVWNYNGGGVTMLGEIVDRAAGVGLEDFSEQYLFEPLGITDWYWPYIRPGLVAAHGDLKLRPRDMAKFGQLFLDGGVWNGQRIVSEEWVEKSTQLWYEFGGIWWGRSDAYGYLWWHIPFSFGGQTYRAYSSMGWGGQYITVFPELDMVVVFTGGNYATAEPNYNILQNHIIPAVVE
jgi:CubicO group peptidase (beta-lactamase class C family)